MVGGPPLVLLVGHVGPGIADGAVDQPVPADVFLHVAAILVAAQAEAHREVPDPARGQLVHDDRVLHLRRAVVVVVREALEHPLLVDDALPDLTGQAVEPHRVGLVLADDLVDLVLPLRAERLLAHGLRVAVEVVVGGVEHVEPRLLLVGELVGELRVVSVGAGVVEGGEQVHAAFTDFGASSP